MTSPAHYGGPSLINENLLRERHPYSDTPLLLRRRPETTRIVRMTYPRREGHMLSQSIPKRYSQVFTGDAWIGSAKIVLILLVVLIAITPITQSIWTNDNFLHGHDTETTVALALTFVSLSLLRVQNTRDNLEELLKRIKGFLAVAFAAWTYPPKPAACSSQKWKVHSGRYNARDHTGYRRPLLI